jgi:basic membrane lipoprotein Med (substrate-binding protein (PBP1-ABC) superfamily)
MLKKTLLAVCAVVMVLGVAPAVLAQDMTVEKVCLVTDVGRVNDGTFNQYAYEGMIRAVEEFDLDSDYIETTASTDYEANIDTCIQGGAQIVITVGFLIADATSAAATANPDVYFIGVDQFQMDGPTNYVGVQFREDQAGFLVGALAALVAEANEIDTIAGVYGIAIPPVVKFRNGYEQGAKYINPDLNILGTYIDDFVAPDRGAEAATQFIGEGAGVIFGAGGPTGSGAIRKAAEEGVYVIGVDQDEYFTTFGAGETTGAEFLISSALKKVDVGVYDMIAALVNMDMEAFPGGGLYILDVNNGGITFAEKHDADVDDAIYEAVAEIEAMLVAGDIETGVDPNTGELMSAATDVEAMMMEMSIADVVVATTEADSPEFTVLLAAVLAADPAVLENLSTGGPFTVFAPTDAAFAAALEALGLTADELLADQELLTTVLMYHVVDGAITSDMLSTMMADTMQGGQLDIQVADGAVTVNGANVVVADIVVKNGVIHIIDGVLLPPQ